MKTEVETERQRERNSFTFDLDEVEAWPEAVEGNVLLDEIAGVLRRFVVLPKWAAETLALWTVHTYASQLRDVTTYIGVESPEKRCGKTTLLGVLSELVNRPVVAANISSPAFFRVIEETRPTLLIDEADTFLQGNDELRGILNSGYHRKTAYVVRVANVAQPSSAAGAGGVPPPMLRANSDSSKTGEDAGETRSRGRLRYAETSSGSRLARFSCWCPKVMAAIGRFPDTLADRCVVIRMQRKTAGEQCERLRQLDATILRRQCVRFVSDNAERIAIAKPQIPQELNDRAADIWEPLLALADLAGGAWPQLARQVAIGLSSSAQEQTPIGSLLFDILLAFSREKEGRIFSRHLVEDLNCAADRPWAEMRNGKPITEIWLAQRLRPYGIRPKALWIGEHCGKGYMEEDFREAFVRYIPRAELQAIKEEMQTASGRSRGGNGA